MLTLEKVQGNVKALTGKASDLVRGLAFAGIALVWVFRQGGDQTQNLHPTLVLAALLCAAALAADLLHYVVAATLWGRFFRRKEKEVDGKDDRVFLAPEWINWPAEFFWWSKIVLVIAGYVAIAMHLAPMLRQG